MQYVSFDYLFWVLTAYFTLRLLKSQDPRWWIAVGGAIGLGLMAKYSIVFFTVGLLVGLLLTNERRYFRSGWLWLGLTVSLLIFLPNLVWQVRNGFVSLDFLRHIHARDVQIGRTKNFLPEQLLLTLLAFPLCVAGLWFYLVSEKGRRFRVLGYMYVIPLLLFLIAKARGYYLAAAYPVLYAAGSAQVEERLAFLKPDWKSIVKALVAVALIADIVMATAFMLPLAPINSEWWKAASQVQGDFREELGWQELVETVAKVRDSLGTADRGRLGILAGNYGEAGSINLYGPQHGLPRAISGINSFWQHGYGNPPPAVVIVIGLPRQYLDEHFSSCEVAAHTWNRYGVLNEETADHADIFLCRVLRQSWPDFWRDFRYYG